MFQLNSGVFRFELPVDAFTEPVPVYIPSGDFLPQLFDALNPTTQALPGQNTQFNFGHIQPTSVLWRKMNLQAIRNTLGLFGRKCLVKGP